MLFNSVLSSFVSSSFARYYSCYVFPSELSRSSAYAACNRPREGLRNACLRRVLGVGPPIRRTTPRPFWRWWPTAGPSLDYSGSSLGSSGSSLDYSGSSLDYSGSSLGSSGSSLGSSGSSLDYSGSSLDSSGSSGASTPPATPINRKHQVFIIIHFIHVYHNYCTGSLHFCFTSNYASFFLNSLFVNPSVCHTNFFSHSNQLTHARIN